jgi:hypothetical protein
VGTNFSKNQCMMGTWKEAKHLWSWMRGAMGIHCAGSHSWLCTSWRAEMKRNVQAAGSRISWFPALGHAGKLIGGGPGLVHGSRWPGCCRPQRLGRSSGLKKLRSLSASLLGAGTVAAGALLVLVLWRWLCLSVRLGLSRLRLWWWLSFSRGPGPALVQVPMGPRW